MRFLSKAKDGGPKSTVWGFWLVEIKWLFSIVILCFEEGSREAYHSHAFNAYTWWLKGSVTEYNLDGPTLQWKPSLKPKFTPRECFHKVFAHKRTWAISFRGPWNRRWMEYLPATREYVTMENGRKVVAMKPRHRTTAYS